MPSNRPFETRIFSFALNEHGGQRQAVSMRKESSRHDSVQELLLVVSRSSSPKVVEMLKDDADGIGLPSPQPSSHEIGFCSCSSLAFSRMSSAFSAS